jgi:hypothetical protein
MMRLGLVQWREMRPVGVLIREYDMISQKLEQHALSRSKKALVVIRCGDASLHPEYVNQHADFDVVLSYFGNDLPYDLTHIQYVHYCKGSKWEGLNAFFQANPSIWQAYDYIWLPDDDLSSDVANINQFLQIAAQERFDLAQPGLTHNSYWSFLITRQVKGLRYRVSNFVEVMAPLFSRSAFAVCVDTFAENKSGFGLDFLWRTLLKGRKIGIIDQTPVFHTRPVGSAGNGMGAQKAGNVVTPRDERKALFKKYRIFAKNKKCTSAVTEGGVRVDDARQLRALITQGLPKDYTEQAKNKRKIHKLVCPEKYLKYIFW